VASLSEVDRKIGSESFVAGNVKAILFHMRGHANEDLTLNVKMVYDLGKCFQNQYFRFLRDHSRKSYAHQMIKMGKVKPGAQPSLSFSFKQQVMVNSHHCPDSSTSIGVETPAVLLPFLNCLTDPPVIRNLHAFIYFQPNLTFGNTLEWASSKKFATYFIRSVEKRGKVKWPVSSNKRSFMLFFAMEKRKA